MRIFSFSLSLLLVVATSLVVSGPVRAELPPSAYEEMQKEAPEVLEIEITRVATKSRDGRDLRNISVFADAVVKGVTRSKNGVKIGDKISLRYMTFEVITSGWAGPGPIGRVSKGNRYRAYLKKAGPHFYAAAKGWTFDEVK